MSEVMIKLPDTDSIKSFNRLACQLACDLDVEQGRFCVDAKSILGLYSMDLTKEVKLVIHDEGEGAQKAIDLLQEFICG